MYGFYFFFFFFSSRRRHTRSTRDWSSDVCSSDLSDGLSDVLREDEIAELLRTDAAPQPCAERLVEQALRDGARDNVTVIVADVVTGSSGAQPPVVVGAAADESTVSTS